MGLFTKSIQSLEDLFEHGLKDIYYAENQIVKALPKLIKAATNPQLKKGLKDHLKETEGQVSRLEQIFEMREESPRAPSATVSAAYSPKAMSLPVMLATRPFWTPRSSPRRRPSNTMR